MSYKKIKSFEDACEVLKIKPSTLDLSEAPVKHQKSLSAYYKLMIIAEALNEGWAPDWSDMSQYKYVPYFIHKSGVGLSYFDLWTTNTSVGSRLCYKTAELAKYAATQFADIYNDFLTIK